jgi:hypothetical protein
LLGDIKRSYKKPPKKHSIQEEKKEEHASFNTRFDEIQQQMETLAEKLDLLISIVTSSNQNGVFVTGKRKVHAGGKRRRHVFDDCRESPPVSDVTDPTAVSKGSSSASLSSTDSSSVAAVKVVPHFTLDMDAVDEEAEDFESAVGRDPRELYRDLIELRASTREIDEDHHLQHSAPPEGVDSMNQEQEASDDDDFKKYIDKMLGNVQDSAMQCEQHEREAIRDNTDSSVDSTSFVVDPLMTKSNPDAVHSDVRIPQTMTSAIMVSHREYGEYDEEAGVFASSTPLTTVVAVEDAPVVRKRFSRRFKILVATSIVIVLVALIWPLAVFLGNQNQSESRSEPLKWEDGSGGGPDGSGSGSWRDGDSSERDGGGSAVDNSGDNGSFGPSAKSIQGDVLTLAWQGDLYECAEVQPTP